jgi:hypothetical protein
MISTKKSIGTSPFQLVHGTYVVFPVQLGLPVVKFLQVDLEEPNIVQRRICQLIEVQQTKELLNEKYHIHQDKVKAIFDKRTKNNDFRPGDLVLTWDARREDKHKHVKFDNLWFGPFNTAETLENNTFIL